MHSRFAFLMLLRLDLIEAAWLMGPEATYAGVRPETLGIASHSTLSGLFAAITRKTGWHPVIFQVVDLLVVLEVAHVVLLAVTPGTCLPIVDFAGAASPFVDDGSPRSRLRKNLRACPHGSL